MVPRLVSACGRYPAPALFTASPAVQAEGYYRCFNQLPCLPAVITAGGRTF